MQALRDMAIALRPLNPTAPYVQQLREGQEGMRLFQPHPWPRRAFPKTQAALTKGVFKLLLGWVPALPAALTMTFAPAAPSTWQMDANGQWHSRGCTGPPCNYLRMESVSLQKAFVVHLPKAAEQLGL